MLYSLLLERCPLVILILFSLVATSSAHGLGEEDAGLTAKSFSGVPGGSLPGGTGQTSTMVQLSLPFQGVSLEPPGPFGTSDTSDTPDANLAVGLGSDAFIVEVFNRGIRVFDKNGGPKASKPFAGSGGIFSTDASKKMFDPRILYDVETGLFVLVALETLPMDSPTPSANGQSWIWLAVTDDPTAPWTPFSTSIASNTTTLTAADVHLDQISLGLDRAAIYVSANLLTFPVKPAKMVGIRYGVFDKQSILDRLQNATPVVWNEVDTPLAGAWTMRAAHILDPPPSQPSVGLFVGAYQGSNNERLRIVKIKDPLLKSSSQLQLTTFDLVVPSYSVPKGDAPQGMDGQPCAETLDVLSGQLINAVWRNGFLYTAHAVDKNEQSRNVARWYQIQTSWPSAPVWWSQLAQVGEIDPGPDQHSFMPTVAVNARDEMSVVYAVAEEGQGASAYVTGRAPCDPPGVLASPILLRSSPSCYKNGAIIDPNDPSKNVPARWGDYFGAALDPDDGETFWVVGEVAETELWTTYIAPLNVVADCGPCECVALNQ